MMYRTELDSTYYAFVSYSHKDQKWAEWIQRAIKHYKLPAVIRKEAQSPLPKRIAPVFRDATDLGVGVHDGEGKWTKTKFFDANGNVVKEVDGK